MERRDPRGLRQSREDGLESYDGIEDVDSHVRPPAGVRGFRLLVFLGVLVGVAALVLMLVQRVKGPFRIKGTGPGVEELATRARVVLEDEEVGFVEWIGSEEGQPVARIKLQEGLRDRLGRKSKFLVGSINEYFPGNVGIRILPVPPSESGDVVSDDAIVTLETNSLPGFPPKFWLAIAILAVGLVLAVILCRVFQSALLLIGGLVAVAMLGVYFATSVGAAY